MEKIAILLEHLVAIPGQPGRTDWRIADGERHDSISAAIARASELNFHAAGNPFHRVIERVLTTKGEVVDNQVFPHWEPRVRVHLALARTTRLIAEAIEPWRNVAAGESETNIKPMPQTAA